jgi:alkylation response protein AidB-like acyl-CoA dehydrogenase
MEGHTMSTERSRPQDAESLLAACLALGPKISAATEEIEQGRRIPTWLVEELRNAGVFRMSMPREWGGVEADPMAQLRVIEQLAYFDASVGWCSMIGSDGGYFSGFLEPSAAREIYRDIDCVTGAGVMPLGEARIVPGGYRVSGRWPFGSGCQHSDWIAAGCIVWGPDGPILGDNGIPETRLCMVPAKACDIIDTWKTTGLRGTGSHDWSIGDYFVTEAHSFNLMSPTLFRQGPLYRLPSMFFYNFPGVALGIARAAIDTFLEISKRKRVPLTGTPLAEEPYIASAVGEAEALLGSSRAYIFETTQSIWNTLVTGGGARRSEPSMLHPDSAYSELTAAQRAGHRLAMSQCHSACVQVVDLMYKAAGSASIYASGRLDRLLRDIHTVNQHNVISLKSYEGAGRLLLGLEPEQPFF